MENTDDDKRLGQWWYSGLDTDTQRVARMPLAVRERHGAQALIEEPKITVGTTHSLKGSESDTVVMFPDLSYAAWQEWTGKAEARDEIIRLGYVAMTRARSSLYIANSSGNAMPVGRFCAGRMI